VQIAIIGGGAAGFFAAITCARADPANDVSIFERGSHFLTKVRISGGGRCNVTNVCSDPIQLSEHFPRGRRALISPFAPVLFEGHGRVVRSTRRQVKGRTRWAHLPND
jgi:predicted flavoprotein YhiN